ncbi:MAG: hypothetical protein ACO2ZP_09005 [Bacteriovoracaceae bacterium]
MDMKKEGNVPWYHASGDVVHDVLWLHVSRLFRDQSYRDSNHDTYFRLQDQQESVGPSSGGVTKAKLYDRLTLNIVRQSTEALGSKIFQEEVKALCMTDEGNFSQQENSKKLEQFLDGTIHRTKNSEKGEKVFFNAATFGKGFLKSYIGSDKRLNTESVLAPKIKFDENECLFGPAKTMYQIEYYDKHELADLYPSKKAEILSGQRTSYEDDLFFNQFINRQINIDNYIRVIEAWKLNGRHVISIEGATLLDEAYPFDYFPFSDFSIFPKLLGPWGEGISERLLYHQFEINKTLRTIGKIIHVGCIPKVFVDASGDIKAGHFTNSIGEIVKYTGQIPQYGQLLKVPPELWQHLDYFTRKAFDEVGVSDMLATGDKPKGVNTAKAQSELLEIGEGRLFPIIKRWQRFHMENFNLWLKLHADSNDKDLEVVSLGEYGLKKLNFDEIQYDRDLNIIELYSGNLLSKHPSIKRQQVTEMMNAGLFDKDQSMDLLDYQDIKRVTSNELAPHKLIKKIIADIIRTGEIYPASEELFLEVAIPLVVKAIAYYKTMDTPPETLNSLIEFGDNLIAIKTEKEKQRMAHELALAQSGQLAQPGNDGKLENQEQLTL